MDLGQIRHWQVIDPAPDFLKVLDPVIVAQIYKAQIKVKQDFMKVELKIMNEYYGKVGRILDSVARKRPAK
jgi:hypothetical protein